MTRLAFVVDLALTHNHLCLFAFARSGTVCCHRVARWNNHTGGCRRYDGVTRKLKHMRCLPHWARNHSSPAAASLTCTSCEEYITARHGCVILCVCLLFLAFASTTPDSASCPRAASFVATPAFSPFLCGSFPCLMWRTRERCRCWRFWPRSACSALESCRNECKRASKCLMMVRWQRRVCAYVTLLVACASQ